MSSNEERLERLQLDADHELAAWQAANRKLQEMKASGECSEGEIRAQQRHCEQIAARANNLQLGVERQAKLIAYIQQWKAQYRP